MAGTRILVVDDEPETVKLTALVLKRAGASVATTASAIQALDRVQTLWPDVALIDLEMPALDGYGLIARLRELGQRVGRPLPAIAFTAHGAETDCESTRSAGFGLHLVKPIRPAAGVAGVVGG